jgi:hypothetical protein
MELTVRFHGLLIDMIRIMMEESVTQNSLMRSYLSHPQEDDTIKQIFC